MDNFNHGRVVDQEQSTNEVADMISLLPDNILHQVLSYLPTKEAAVTAVLSKRWKDIWKSIPIIDIDDSSLDIQDESDVTRFTNFINRVFQMRDEYSSLNMFRLYSLCCFPATPVYDWISIAIRQNVQELDLRLSVNQPFMFPDCVFYSAKIMVFKLEMSYVLHLPSNIFLPSLKMLDLRHVTFPNESSTQSLFSSCPSLAHLSLIGCDWINLRSISITLPSLKVLDIIDFSLPNSDNPEGCKISICARNIMLFVYCGNLVNEINFHDISSLALASIDIPILGSIQEDVTDRAVKLIGGLKSVGCLNVFEDAFEYLFLADNVLPALRNLRGLNLAGKFGNHSTELLIKLLRCLPKLEYLYVAEGLDEYGEDGELVVGSDCVLSSLNTVNYHNLQGTDAEICFLRFLLQNATVLEKMSIFWSTSCAKEPNEREEITTLLHGVSRGSSRCLLTLT